MANEVIPPASAPTGDALGVPTAVQPGRFVQYAMAGAQVFRAMAGPMISAVTGLPSLAVNPARVGSTTKGNEVAGVGPQPRSYLDQVTPLPNVTLPSDKTNEIHRPTAAFTTDSSKAHLVINAKGEPELQAGRIPTKADKEVSVYVDPKFEGAKDPVKVAAAIDKANNDEKLKAAGIQIQKPADMAKAIQTAQEQQVKTAEQAKQAEKAKIDKGQNTNPGEKKPVPNGGGGGGGGGGCAPPDKINRPNQGGDKNGGRPNANRTEASTLPKPYTENSSFISDKGGVNNGSYPEFINAVYSNIPGFSGAGGLMSQFADIDNSNMTPEEKAAAKAKLMAAFQREHEKDITDNTKAYAKEMSDFGDKDSATGIENIGTNLADPSKAGAIVNMLEGQKGLSQRTDNKLAADDKNVSAVFDEKGRHALTNLALVEKGIDWKAPSRDKNGLTSEGKARADAVSKIVTEPFKFRRR